MAVADTWIHSLSFLSILAWLVHCAILIGFSIVRGKSRPWRPGCYGMVWCGNTAVVQLFEWFSAARNHSVIFIVHWVTRLLLMHEFQLRDDYRELRLLTLLFLDDEFCDNIYLTMEPHTRALSSSCFIHIRSFKQIRSSLDDGMAVSVASALVSSRLDQVKSILYGAASKHKNRFQRVQNALARVVTYQRPYTSPLSSTALLQNLHWLPIEWRVHFKLATLAYNLLHTGQRPYLSELFQHYEPTRTLQSSSSFQLSVPWYNLEFGSRAFWISAPTIWNLLPANIRNSSSLPTFRRHLKTHYFQSAYPNL